MQHILVIDDDPAVTSLLKRGLAYEGFAVATACSGVEGLTMARERAADLVVLDVMMPGLNGYEVLQRLRAADDQPRIQAALGVSHSSSAGAFQGGAAGARLGLRLR